MSRRALWLAAGFAALIGGGAAIADQPIPMGQQDTFEDGTVQGWIGGAIVTNRTGGPTGRYLQVQSNASANEHWGTKNPWQWGGGQSGVYKNYVTNGIKGIALDVSNFGPDPVAFRLMFVNGSEQWASNVAYTLQAGSGWQHVVFGITAADMTHVQGTGSWATTMSHVQRMSFHDDPGGPGAGGNSLPISATVGLDNITAVATPEPTTMLLVAIGGLAALRRRAR